MKKLKTLLIPVVLSVLFVVLAMVQMNLSIWHDEAYSAYLIRGNFADIWNLTAIDVHPPLFYFCLKVWSMMFGNSEIALRMMSVMFGVVAIFVAFYLLKKLFNTKTASIATFVMTLSPLFIRYAEEARMYTMVLAIALISTLVMVMAISRDKKGKWNFWWLLYGVMLAAGMMTHYFMALVFVAQLAYLIYHYRAKIWRLDLILGYAVAILLFVPWLPKCLAQVTNVQGGFWIPELTVATGFNFLIEGLVYAADATWIKGWEAFLVLAAVVGLVYLVVKFVKTMKSEEKSGRDSVMLLVFLTLVPPVLLMILSLPPLKPMFETRYLITSMTIMWMVLGVMLAKTKLNKKGLAMAVLAIITVAVVGISGVYSRWANSDINVLLADIKTHSNNTTVVAGTERVYLDVIFYEGEDLKVYGVSEYYHSDNGAFAPMKQYRYKIMDTISEVPEREYWMIFETGAEDLPDYVERIDTDEHIAVKVVK